MNLKVSWPRFVRLDILLAVACLAVLTSCQKATEQSADTGLNSGTHANTVKLPVVTQTVEEIRQEMESYEPFSPEFDESRIKLLVVLDEIRKREGVEGFEDRESPPESSRSPSVYADPETGKVAWRALTCWNPNCPGKGRGGGPFLFTRPFSSVTVGEDGKLIIGVPPLDEMMKPVYCPACRESEFIRPYELPESAVREKELKAELKKIYATYAQAASEGIGISKSGRTPEDIMNDLNNLPKVFLLEEPGKVKEFDAVTAPTSGGLGSG